MSSIYGDTTWTGYNKMVKYKRHPWVWLGDDPNEGSGLFYQEDDAGDYVNVVRIEACNQAGGPDNLYHIEVGTLYMPAAKKPDVLSAIGVVPGFFAELGHVIKSFGSEFEARMWIAAQSVSWAFTTMPPVPRNLLVHAYMSSTGLDVHHQHVVRVGPENLHFHNREGWNPKPDHILRNGASVKKFARTEYC